MNLLKQSTARNIMIFLTDATDNASGKTGATLTITASKDGGAFSSITPTVTERGDGWYSLALTTTHTNTLGDLALHITATGAVPTDYISEVIEDLPGTINPTTIAAAVWDTLTSALVTAGSIGEHIVGLLDTSITSVNSNIANLQSSVDALPGFGILRNDDYNGLTFPMFDENTGLPATGLTVSVEVSLDGVAFVATDESPTEVSDGWYTINLIATETDAKNIAVRAFATGARDTTFILYTQEPLV